jgi:hypothetical protein
MIKKIKTFAHHIQVHEVGEPGSQPWDGVQLLPGLLSPMWGYDARLPLTLYA